MVDGAIVMGWPSGSERERSTHCAIARVFVARLRVRQPQDMANAPLARALQLAIVTLA